MKSNAKLTIKSAQSRNIEILSCYALHELTVFDIAVF